MNLKIVNPDVFFKKKNKRNFFFKYFLFLYSYNRKRLGIYVKKNKNIKLTHVKVNYLNRIFKYTIYNNYKKSSMNQKFNVLILLQNKDFFNLKKKYRCDTIDKILNRFFNQL